VWQIPTLGDIGSSRKTLILKNRVSHRPLVIKPQGLQVNARLLLSQKKETNFLSRKLKEKLNSIVSEALI